MDKFLVVRLKLHDSDQAPRVTRAIKDCLEDFHDSRLIDNHLLVRIRSIREVDRMLIDLQSCLENCLGSETGRLPVIIETGFDDKEDKIDLPEDIILDPGFSFGSGSHPSTRLAMVLLERFAAGQEPGRVLDVGCGSGILALLAVRFGAEKALGVEIDPESVAAARKNVEANGFEDIVTVTDQFLSEVRGEFNLILANLTASVFYNLAEDILRLAAEKTHMIVSGLQGRQAEEAASFLEGRGWVRGEEVKSGNWRALLMARNALQDRL